MGKIKDTMYAPVSETAGSGVGRERVEAF